MAANRDEWLRDRTAAALERLANLKADGPAVQQEGARPLLLLAASPIEKCMVPHFALRSSLFAAIGKGRRRHLNRFQLACQNGLSIFYTGEQLDQGDLDVWEAVLHAGVQHPLGASFVVSGYQLLKTQGRSICGFTRAWQYESLVRLKATALEIHGKNWRYVGSLLEDFLRQEDTARFTMRLNPALATIFRSQHFTLLDRSVRRLLRGKPLALWLHGYFSSHADPFPIKVSTLHLWSGSQAKVLRHFKADLVNAMHALVAAHGAVGTTFKFEIDGDLLHVTKGRAAKSTRGKHGVGGGAAGY